MGPDAALVDVGGGNGAAVAAILPYASNISKAIVQDCPPIIEYAKKFWAGSQAASLVRSGRVVLHAHDFFTEQPVRGAQAYFLRHIIHELSGSAVLLTLGKAA